MPSGEATGRAKGAAADAEEAIADAIARGDHRQAATLALRAFGPEIVSYLGTLLGDETEVKDAFSLFGERLWQGFGQFRGDSKVRTWAYRVAWSAASDLRKDAFRARGRRLETSEHERLAHPLGTRTWLRFERHRIALEHVRALLPLDDQCLLQLRVDRGLSWAECAEVLAAGGRAPSEASLRKRFERLKARIREAFEDDPGPA